MDPSVVGCFGFLLGSAAISLMLSVLRIQCRDARRSAEHALDELEELRHAARLTVELSELPTCKACRAPATRQLDPTAAGYRERDESCCYCDQHAPGCCVEIPRAKLLRPLIMTLGPTKGDSDG